MTDPINLRGARLDDIPTYAVDGMIWPATVPYTDQLGRVWFIPRGGDKGFLNPAPPRTSSTDLPQGHGARRGTAWRGVKPATLAGRVWVPRGLRDRTEADLAALCADGGRTYTLRRRTAQTDLVREVELDAAPQWDWTTLRRLDFSFAFRASDPRARDRVWQEPRCWTGASNAPALGLDYSGSGLNYAGSGLDYGAVTTAAAASTVQVANYGSAPCGPVLELRGRLSGPVWVVDQDHGWSASYLVDVALGETVYINCDEHPQRGLQPHECVSSLRGNVRSLVTVGTEWPVLDPRTAATFELRATGDATGSLTVPTSSAYW